METRLRRARILATIVDTASQFGSCFGSGNARCLGALTEHAASLHPCLTSELSPLGRRGHNPCEWFAGLPADAAKVRLLTSYTWRRDFLERPCVRPLASATSRGVSSSNPTHWKPYRTTVTTRCVQPAHRSQQRQLSCDRHMWVLTNCRESLGWLGALTGACSILASLPNVGVLSFKCRSSLHWAQGGQ